MKFTDYLGRPIKIGDKVLATSPSGRSGHRLLTGYVIRFTAKMVFIGKQGETEGGDKKDPKKVIVINQQEHANKQDYPELYL